MKIERATTSDAKVLTQLTIRSKAYWGYSKQQMLDWTEALTLPPSYFSTKEVYKLMANNQPIGYYSYTRLTAAVMKLENLFIDPEFIGKGFGKLLLLDFLNRIEQEDFATVTLDSDPNAQEFYKRLGFKVVGQMKTPVKDRYLPIMEMDKPQVQTLLST